MKHLGATSVVFLALVAGCVTTRAATSPHANLARYQTYAWYESPTPKRSQEKFERSVAGELVRERIARGLAARGIHEDTRNPDFLVAYGQRFEDKLEVNDWGYPRLYWGAPDPVHVQQYKEGTLIVDFIDPATGRVFWRGMASAIVDRPARPNLEKLAIAVDKLIQKYPAAVTTASAKASRPAM